MAGCLTAPSHYLNQCWLTINEILWHSFQGNIYLNTQDINPQVVFKIHTSEFTAISHRGQWVNCLTVWDQYPSSKIFRADDDLVQTSTGPGSSAVCLIYDVITHQWHQEIDTLHWVLNKNCCHLQTFSNASSSMKIIVFWLKIHWSLFRSQMSIGQNRLIQCTGCDTM